MFDVNPPYGGSSYRVTWTNSAAENASPQYLAVMIPRTLTFLRSISEEDPMATVARPMMNNWTRCRGYSSKARALEKLDATRRKPMTRRID